MKYKVQMFAPVYASVSVSPCKSNNPCQNSGRCYTRRNERGYRCYCKGHYYGENCEKGKYIWRNSCTSNNKDRMWYKTNTNKHVSKLSESLCKQENPCQNGGQCETNSYRNIGYSCRCKKGFGGDHCQLGNYIKLSRQLLYIKKQ